MDLIEPKAGQTELDLSVDLAGERPSNVAHGLRPDRLVRRATAGIAGAFVAVLFVAWASSGSDDDEDDAASEVAGRDDDVPRLMKPVLGPALPTAVLGLELVRMDAITADLERHAAENPTRRRVAHKSTTTDSVSARTMPHGGSSAGSSAGSMTGSRGGAIGGTTRSTGASSSSSLRDLPPAPPLDAAPVDGGAPAADADPATPIPAPPAIETPDADVPESETPDAPTPERVSPRDDAEPTPPPSPS